MARHWAIRTIATLWQAKNFLERDGIHFQPGVNEDLAATAVWGSQQVNLIEPSNKDGVVGIWYGKGPGVDRSGDVFRHANTAGTAAGGGVLVLLGDDHGAKSSTIPHQSEYAMMHAMIPVLNPAGVQELLDFGLHGIALSRYSGLWVGFKCVTMTIDSSASVSIDPSRIEITTPDNFAMPEDGLNIRWPDTALGAEVRMTEHKLPAAQAYVRANRLDRTIYDSPDARIGIVTAGKSYLDVMQALEDLGIDADLAAAMGLRVYKLAMTWPIEPEGVREFAAGLEEIIVVEEKRGLIEDQIKELLYNAPDRPARIVGKRDETGAPLLPETNELEADAIARVLGRRLTALDDGGRLSNRLIHLEAAEARTVEGGKLMRTPYFCSGCPHNSSTKVPDGSRALAGIGCHYLVQGMDRETATYTQMGGEGVSWAGQAPFTDRQHIFVNLGDGTYFHSGLLAIRAAVASGANMTYKILYNDAAAMTGGQPLDGHLDVPQITRQLAAEGVRKTYVVSDEPDKYPVASEFAPGVTIHHRDEMDELQRSLREVEGVTALVYDQVCATEKRRRRKRGKMIDPARRAFINELVCEGCGDCSVASNCVSIEPLETEFGRKRQVNQSSCNKDLSCVDGFCPSFVTVEGGSLRNSLATPAIGPERDHLVADLADPTAPSLERPWNIVVTGVGGTGVVTIGALIGIAAHIEGKACTVLDKVGAAQKNGAVLCQIKVAANPDQLHALNVGAQRANLLLGCDLVVAAGREALEKVGAGLTHAVINDHDTPVAGFIHNPDLDFAGSFNQRLVAEAVGTDHTTFCHATELATALFGDAIATNAFLLGVAYQKGLLPVSADALHRAMELNGVAVAMNKRAFAWGRLTAAADQAPISLNALIARRGGELARYQNRAYARRYRELVAKVRAAEAAVGEDEALSTAVARGAYTLMAYKDEYEVARLYTDGRFLKRLRDTFDGDYRLRIAPPLFARRDPRTDTWPLSLWRSFEPRISGSCAARLWIRSAIARDGASIEAYFATIDGLLGDLTAVNHATAVEIARMPERIRAPRSRAQSRGGAAPTRCGIASRRVTRIGRPSTRFGGPMLAIFRTLANFRFLRGTPLDPFGYSAERRGERRLIEAYFATIDGLLGDLTAVNHATAVEIARMPERIRGFGHVKERNLEAALKAEAALLQQYRGDAVLQAAE